MYTTEKKSALIKELLKKYNNKHIEQFYKKYGISNGSKFLNNNITWRYYTIDHYSLVITTEYNVIKDITAAY